MDRAVIVPDRVPDHQGPEHDSLAEAPNLYSPVRSTTAFRMAHEGHQIAIPPVRSRTRPYCFDCDERG